MTMVVVIANNEKKRKAIIKALENEGGSSIELSSLAELQAILKEVPVCGIILDLITSTKATAQEKLETNSLIQLYPNLKVKVIEDNLITLGNGMSMRKFVQDCQAFKPRTIRKSIRRDRHIAFLLSADSKFTVAEKVVTLNISDDGCFIYSTNDWRVGDRVWLHFIDNECVMSGIVCWWQPWGNNKKMPGIGIRFDVNEIK
ncbi:MAG TPA: PilZ domain-containing protein [Dongiaceae bacterium]|nr:PilZ domain-containing protein [Dongiaceae bacterium]